MIRHIIALLTCCLVTALTAGAQDFSKEIVLDDNTSQGTVVYNHFLEVKVECQERLDDGARVAITIVNRWDGTNTEPYKIFLFRSGYTRDYLKKQKIELKGDQFSLFNAKNSKETTDHVRFLGSEYIDTQLETLLPYDQPLFDGDETSLQPVTLPLNLPVTLRIPTYMCSKIDLNKRGELKKVEIFGCNIFDLKIQVKGKVKPKENQVLRDLRDALETLEESIENTSFCNHKRHDPPLKQQKQQFLDRVDDLKQRAQAELNNQGYERGSEEYRPFTDFFGEVDQLNKKIKAIKGQNCGEHKPDVIEQPKHKCAYCDYTSTQIENTLHSLARTKQQTGKCNTGPAKAIQKCPKAQVKLTQKAKRDLKIILDDDHNCAYCSYSSTQIENTLHSLARTKQQTGQCNNGPATAIKKCPKASKKLTQKANGYLKIIFSKDPDPKLKTQIASKLNGLLRQYRSADASQKQKIKKQADALYNQAKSNGWGNDPQITKEYNRFK
ncbi:MAG: hypothetical protein IJ160_04985 [Muribaculaceae bacterium]|nr:hypothetical protein [Muribaculaceae bacterium]